MLALALLFTGCTAGVNEQTGTSPQSQTVTAAGKADTTAAKGSSNTVTGTTAKGAAATGTAAKTGSTKSGTPTGSTAAKAKGSSGKSTTTTRATNSAKWQGGSAGLIPTGGTTRKQTTQKHTTKRHTTPQSKTVTCTITVECKNIHKHMSQLKSGHERFVPNDSYIIHAESHTVDRGSTAYDVLKLACNAHGIRLTARSTSYGVYVVGINNLDEKDCGGVSGWMYKVNGTAPLTSCGKYKMDNGDNLVFYYVCTGADR